MIQALFVYGTLQPGHKYDHLLEAIGGTWQAASVFGTLHPEGWGATEGFPALVLDQGGKEVKGFVFHSETLKHHWSRLDEFEGKAYRRVVTVAKLDSGQDIETYVYELNRGDGAPGRDQ